MGLKAFALFLVLLCCGSIFILAEMGNMDIFNIVFLLAMINIPTIFANDYYMTNSLLMFASASLLTFMAIKYCIGIVITSSASLFVWLAFMGIILLTIALTALGLFLILRKSPEGGSCVLSS